MALSPDEQRLCDRLGLSFADPEWLRLSLRHRSVGARNNERLEFLGDAVLNMVAAEALFERRPEAPEGDLSRLRAALVREKTLAQLARESGIGEFLELGSGELRSGGSRRASILADAVEALIAAVYLDGGFGPARAFVLRLLEERLDNLPAAETLKDAKTRLQEWLQARGRPLPEYDVLSVSGAAHDQHFVAACRLCDETRQTRGEGRGRRRAEQAAAAHMLQELT